MRLNNEGFWANLFHLSYRLLLLLQSSLKLWNEEAEGHHSHPLPLSLPSAVKKYCRKLLHRTKHTHDLQQQVAIGPLSQAFLHECNLFLQLAAKDLVISSLKSSLARTQEECQLLQHALQDATSDSRPSSVLPRSLLLRMYRVAALECGQCSYTDVFHMRLGILSR